MEEEGGSWEDGVRRKRSIVVRDYHKCVFPLLSKGKKSTFP
jgi:hypothetical protein